MGVTELAATEEFAELREAYRAFMEEHVYPDEPALAREDEAADALMRRAARAKAKARGALGAAPAARRRAAPAAASSRTRT